MTTAPTTPQTSLELSPWEARVLERLIAGAAPDGICDETDLEHAAEHILPRLRAFTAHRHTGYDHA